MVSSYLDAFEDDIWEEKPLPFKQFVYEIIKHPPLSPLQIDIGERMSQVLRYETLVELWGEEEADRLWKKTARDLCLIIGKGGSKNLITQLSFLYIIYTLLCMKSPQEYYEKPPDDNIDLVNMATSARQAQNGFFNKIKATVERVDWFAGKFHPRAIDISFDKHITLHSLHSQPEAAEALNIMAVVLDEVDSPEVDGQEMYQYLSGTVTSRYPTLGKVCMLSFPRSKDGFIMTFYDKAVGDRKIVETKHHTFKFDNSLPDGIEDNEFTVSWEEETPTGYKSDTVYCAKYPAYKVNPKTELEQYKQALADNMDDALMRFFANPPEAGENAFFRNHAKLEAIFDQPNGWDRGDLMVEALPDTNYYIHVDLSQVKDRTVVALGHVEEWRSVDQGLAAGEPKPCIRIDLFRVWEPTRKDPVDHNEVMDFVMMLCKKFKVVKVTFDQWGSLEKIRYLNECGIYAEKKSLGRAEYMEFAQVVSEMRLVGPYDDRLLTELKHLVILNTGKVDHPDRHHNDISEAICGVIRNCVENEDPGTKIKIVTLATIQKKQRERELYTVDKEGKIEAPDDIKRWLKSFKTV